MLTPRTYHLFQVIRWQVTSFQMIAGSSLFLLKFIWNMISAPLCSTTWIRKTIRFILAVSAEHRRHNNTLYSILYYIQICGVKTRTELSDSLHRILSEQRPEKNLLEKTSVGKKTRQEIWVGSMAHTLKSPSYKGYTAGRSLPFFTKQVFQQRTANSK